MRRFMSLNSAGSTIATYLDDLVALPLAVWSIQKLVSTATLAVRVRRSSDSFELDIGFTGKAIDTVSLAAFVGGDSAFVTKFYDQSGGGYDAVQANPVQQARIVNAGVYDGYVVFDGANDYYKATSLPFATAQVGIYARMSSPSIGTSVILESSANVSSNAGAFLIYEDQSGLPNGYNAAMGVSGSQRLNNFTNTLGVMKQYTTLFDKSLADTSEIQLFQNGTQLTATAFNTVEQSGTFSTNDVYMGARQGPTLPSAMSVDSMILYAVDTAALRASIETLF